jgi:hypothetical protein
MAAVNETQSYFRVHRRAAPLVLPFSRGRYSRLYRQYGEDAQPACAKDAQTMYRLPIGAEYCGAGVDADAIFFPTMAQKSPGVAGWGTDVLRDQGGRPIFLIMGWSVPSSAAERQREDDSGEWRRTVLHELIHGLGFSLQQFRDARIAEQRPMPEIGAPGGRDDVWVATGARVLAIGRQYFNCSSLDAVPLMGSNPLGPGSRGSHWETRLLADEIMAYGRGNVVSAFTLAIMEDLGFYLANYAALSGCLQWGRGQGCAFVSTRCQRRQNDLSVVAISSSQCNYIDPMQQRCRAQDSAGAVWCTPPDSFLLSKCNPPRCGSGKSGVAAAIAGSGVRCNAECAMTLSGGSGSGSNTSKGSSNSTQFVCGLAPPRGSVTATCHGDACALVDGEWMARAGADWLTGAAIELYGGGALLGLVLCVMALYRCCAFKIGPKRVRALAAALHGIFALAGVGGISGAIFVMGRADELSELQPLASWSLALAVGVTALALLGGCAVLCRRRCALGFFTLLLLMLLLAQIALVVSVAWWLRVSYDAEQSTYTLIDSRRQLGSDGRGGSGGGGASDFEEGVLLPAMRELEGFGCATYRACCSPPPQGLSSSVLNQSCVPVHTGQSVGAVASREHDPTQPRFCQQVTGAVHASQAEVSADTCHGLALAGVLTAFPSPQCANDYCATGVAGLVLFLQKFLGWLHRYLDQLMAFLAGLAAVQLTQLVLSVVLLCRGFGQGSKRADGRRANPMDPRQRFVGSEPVSDSLEMNSINARVDVRTDSVRDEAPEDSISAERARFRRKIARQLANEAP